MAFSNPVAFFLEGGFFMWPILLCSAIGAAIALERFRVLVSASRVKKDEVLSALQSQVLKGDFERALNVVAKVDTPLTNIIRAGLSAIVNRCSPEEVQTAMDSVALREIPRLETRIGLLATVSNIATLLGLLGTVDGLIGAFAAVAGVSPAEKAALLSKSISAAMNTTWFGLLVAIPLLAVFGYLNTLVQRIIDDIHESSVSTLNFIISNRDKL